VVRCPVVPFTDTDQHFYHTAKRIAEERGENAIWINQFENSANYSAHQSTTGPEIATALRTNVDRELSYSSKLDIFVSAVGKGGTMGGVSSYFKSKHTKMNSQFWVADNLGGATKHFVDTGSYEGATTGKSFIEGIGINRVTIGFAQAAPIVNGAVFVSDEEAAKMFHHLLRHEGICVGPSAALNVVGAIKVAKKLNLGPDANVVTILCDSGERYKSTLLNDDWWIEKGYAKPTDDDATDGSKADVFEWIAPA
jgi:cysteine synthase A